MDTPLFTVFTPTFNRASKLERPFLSLQAQIYHNFEWLIVDDGSTDDTEAVVRDLIAKANFTTRYFRQDNSGKHIAFNRAVQEARGELFVCLDSDDECLPDALEKFVSCWQSIPGSDKDNFSGVAGMCIDQNGDLVGTKFPKDILDSDSMEIRYRYRVKGEKWGFLRTAVLIQFPFPTDLRRTCLPESVVWNAIARHYKTRFINEVLRVYWIEGDSLIHGQPVWKNAQGAVVKHQRILNTELDWFKWAPSAFFRSAIHYVRFSAHLQISAGRQWITLTKPVAKLLWLIMLPVGYCIYLGDRLRVLVRNQ